jgi:transcriptional regulator with GAF, ATPase, and Fis domain
VAPADTSVLITGETGTGKELIARAVHSASSRRDKPLIKVNCAALPTGLVESELFGHERGAFSGAIAKRVGRFELANGGTIFLDEVGEIPPEVQVKLLRVLQEREFERVGGNVPIKADVRVIAATNRDLRKAVRAGAFREDLYYRLNVFPLQLPPLRERRDDIPMLVRFLVSKYGARVGKRAAGVSAQTMNRLVEYAWPGNVRELENVIERAMILATSPVVDVGPELLMSVPSPARPPAPDARDASDLPREKSLEAVERDHIRTVLEQTGWVIEGPRGAAGILNLHPNTLRSRLKKLGIRRGAHEGHQPAHEHS